MTPVQKSLVGWDVRILLEQWGRWSRTGLGRQSLMEGTNDNEHWFTDEQGLCIDSLLGKLKVSDRNRFSRFKRRSYRYIVLNRYYRESESTAMIAKGLRVGETKVKNIRAIAEEAISNYMDNWINDQESVDSAAA